MRKYILMVFAIFLFGCGNIDFTIGQVDLTPKKERVGHFIFKFENKKVVKSDVKLRRMVYNVSSQFEPYLGPTPNDEFCCGPIKVIVKKNKPKTPPVIGSKRQEVCEYVYPQDHSVIWHEKLFDNKCGKYSIGKHFVDAMFPVGTSVKEKKKYVDYDTKKGQWDIDLQERY